MREARYVNFGPMQQWRSHCWPGEFAFSDGGRREVDAKFAHAINCDQTMNCRRALLKDLMCILILWLPVPNLKLRSDGPFRLVIKRSIIFSTTKEPKRRELSQIKFL